MNSIGEMIRQARKEAHLTQNELAKKTNLSRSHIGAIETNRYNPSLATLKLIADAIGIDASTLVGGRAIPHINLPEGETLGSMAMKFQGVQVQDNDMVLNESPSSRVLIHTIKGLPDEAVNDLIAIAEVYKKKYNIK